MKTLPSWSIVVAKEENGFSMRWREEIEDSLRWTGMVFEAHDDDELDALVSLLWCIIEHFGKLPSKHHERNINVVINKKSKL